MSINTFPNLMSLLFLYKIIFIYLISIKEHIVNVKDTIEEHIANVFQKNKFQCKRYNQN